MNDYYGYRQCCAEQDDDFQEWAPPTGPSIQKIVTARDRDRAFFWHLSKFVMSLVAISVFMFTRGTIF